MERYYKSYATQREQARNAVCNPIYDFLWGSMLVFGVLNVAGLNIIWGKNPVIQTMGTFQVLIGGGALALKYGSGVCR